MSCKCLKTHITNIRLLVYQKHTELQGDSEDNFRETKKKKIHKLNENSWDENSENNEMFFKNSSGFAKFCWSPGSFHEKPTGVQALAAFGKAAFPRLLLRTAHRHNPWTPARLQPGAAAALDGHREGHRLCKEAQRAREETLKVRELGILL